MIKIIDESIEYHDELNPKIWNGDKLNPEVKSKVLEIVNEFVDNVEIPMEVVDVHILGSNASYNYTKHSDLDVHIIVNFDMIGDCSNILQAYFNSEKKVFNDNYDISIHGINVEMYVEDIRANTVSNGIYSVYEDRWVKYPEYLVVDTDIDLEPELSDWISKVNDSLSSNDLAEVKSTINSLYLLRKNSLAVEGEFGKGNQIFKEIRSQGLLDDLKDRMYELTSKELSLESIRESITLNELNTRGIDRHILNLLTRAGCTVTNTYNSMQTTKGVNASRQLTVHVDIVSPSGTKYRIKFDPEPMNAIPRRDYRYVPYDPKVHKNKKLYVLVPATGYSGDYNPKYDVYVEMTNNPNIETDTTKPIFVGKVNSANDFFNLMTRVDKNF